MDLQKMVDAIGEMGRQERSKYHLTLGKLIETLTPIYEEDKAQDSEKRGYWDYYRVTTDLPLIHPGYAHSYRGYYSDLSFHPEFDVVFLHEFYKKLKETLGKTFTGWKGGDFVMKKDTPLWISPEGQSSDYAVFDVYRKEKEVIVLKTKEVE